MAIEPFNYLKASIICQNCGTKNEIMHAMNMEAKKFRKMKVYHLDDFILDDYTEDKTYSDHVVCKKCNSKVHYSFNIESGKITDLKSTKVS